MSISVEIGPVVLEIPRYKLGCREYHNKIIVNDNRWSRV